MNADFIEAFKQIEREKELDSSKLLKSVEKALAIAYKQSHNTEQDVTLRIEQGSAGGGKNGLLVFRVSTVVDGAVSNPFSENHACRRTGAEARGQGWRHRRGTHSRKRTRTNGSHCCA